MLSEIFKPKNPCFFIFTNSSNVNVPDDLWAILPKFSQIQHAIFNNFEKSQISSRVWRMFGGTAWVWDLYLMVPNGSSQLLILPLNVLKDLMKKNSLVSENSAIVVTDEVKGWLHRVKYSHNICWVAPLHKIEIL